MLLVVGKEMYKEVILIIENVFIIEEVGVRSV